MSDILKRTCFIDDSIDSCLRPHEWALVQHALGPMMEPFFIFNRHAVNTPVIEWDATEPMCMITEIKSLSKFAQKQILGDTVHGGCLMPRTGP
jgi:hypothetical protein